MAEFQKIIRSERVGEKSPVPARLGATQVVVVRRNGAVHVFRNACPHAGAPLSGGTLQRGWLVCPRHGWEFNVETGACPAHDLYSLKRYEAREADGWVEAAPDDSEIW